MITTYFIIIACFFNKLFHFGTFNIEGSDNIFNSLIIGAYWIKPKEVYYVFSKANSETIGMLKLVFEIDQYSLD